MINLIFDYDGTIHDPVKVFAPAFRETFGKYIAERHGDSECWPDSRIAAWFGVSIDVMLSEIAPYVEPDSLRGLMDMMTASVRERMHSGEASLFPGAEETLRSLRQRGFRLILFSKCDRPHIDRQRKNLPLDEYFDDIFCTGDFGDMSADKAEIFPKLSERFAGHFIIIGDRKQDIDVAQRWQLMSIGCSYGYGSAGELDGASVLAEDISDIPTLVEELIKKSGW